MSKEKIVLAMGTFDLLHPGHLHYLKQAKKNGKLVVIVARDDNVARIKGQAPVFDEQHRLELVSNLKVVDKAVLGSLVDMYATVKKIKPNVICLGYDQQPSNEAIQANLKRIKVKASIKRIKPYKENVYKSHMIRENVQKKKLGYSLDY